MTRVFLGLMTRAGDRLGHLVRAVQMLRSYGSEAKVVRYSDVIDWTGEADQPPALCCLVECMSDATVEGLSGICRETQWALGDEDEVMKVYIMQYGNERLEEGAAPLQAMLSDRMAPGMTAVQSRNDFAKLCDWGQQLTAAETVVAGEWPSATGR